LREYGPSRRGKVLEGWGKKIPENWKTRNPLVEKSEESKLKVTVVGRPGEVRGGNNCDRKKMKTRTCDNIGKSKESLAIGTGSDANAKVRRARGSVDLGG